MENLHSDQDLIECIRKVIEKQPEITFGVSAWQKLIKKAILQTLTTEEIIKVHQEALANIQKFAEKPLILPKHELAEKMCICLMGIQGQSEELENYLLEIASDQGNPSRPMLPLP